MKKKYAFRRIAKIKFKGKFFQIFKMNNGQTAFLEYKNNKYYYPSIDDFKDLVFFFVIGSEKYSFYQDGKHIKYNFIPKVTTKTGVVMITSAMILSILSGCSNKNNDYTTYATDYSSSYAVVEAYVSPYDKELTEESDILDGVEIQPSTDCYETEDFDIMKSSKYVQLYNNKYFTELFGVESYSKEQIISVIQENKSLPQEFRDFYIELAVEMYDTYPGLDFRVFYHNMKDLKIELQSAENISFDTDTVAYYDKDNNIIVVSDNIDIKNNIKDRIIFRHEAGHPFNYLEMEKDGWKIKYSFNDLSRGKYTSEGLNVALTTIPFLDEYEFEDNLGYPITTNIIKVIVDALPNYDYEDSVSNNIYYMQKMMDEYFEDEMDASLAIELIELQWYEYSSDMIEVDEQEYVDLYKYVARLYIKSFVNENMSYEEIMDIEKELELRLTKGVKDESLVYTSIVEDEFLSYVREHGIEVSYTK